MKRIGLAITLAAGSALAALPLMAQSQQGQGRAVVTILPSAKNGNVGQIPTQNLKLKVN